MDSSEITEATAVEVVDHGDDHDHPSDNKYIQIAAILAVLTALEVATYFVDMPGAVLIAALMVLTNRAGGLNNYLNNHELLDGSRPGDGTSPSGRMITLSVLLFSVPPRPGSGDPRVHTVFPVVE